MRKKPRGRKYRNLFARGEAIYYERVVKGVRRKVSAKTSDWDEAAAVRDLLEERLRIGSVGSSPAEAPMFLAFVRRYLDEDTAHLADTTRTDRERELRKDGLLAAFFGPYRVDEITAVMIREWWGQDVDGAGRSWKTGRNYLDALSGVLNYALELGLVEKNPVREFRELLARKSRTQRGRAESDPGRSIRPIEDLCRAG